MCRHLIALLGQASPRRQAQRAQVGGGQVGGVLPYRRQAPGTGQSPGDGQGQDRGQASSARPIAEVGHVPENLGQGLARQGGRGGGWHQRGLPGRGDD